MSATNENYVIPGTADPTAYQITYAANNNKDEPHVITLRSDWGDGDCQQPLDSLATDGDAWSAHLICLRVQRSGGLLRTRTCASFPRTTRRQRSGGEPQQSGSRKTWGYSIVSDPTRSLCASLQNADKISARLQRLTAFTGSCSTSLSGTRSSSSTPSPSQTTPTRNYASTALSLDTPGARSARPSASASTSSGSSMARRASASATGARALRNRPGARAQSRASHASRMRIIMRTRVGARTVMGPRGRREDVRPPRARRAGAAAGGRRQPAGERERAPAGSHTCLACVRSPRTARATRTSSRTSHRARRGRRRCARLRSQPSWTASSG